MYNNEENNMRSFMIQEYDTGVKEERNDLQASCMLYKSQNTTGKAYVRAFAGS